MKIRFSPEALTILEEIYNYLHQFNPRAATRIHNSLLDDIERLADQPFMGHVEQLLDDLPGGYRSLLVGKRYKAVYRIEDEIITIVTIHDCRRDPARLHQLLS
jgi:addiction module RelE/StbE family toxin